MSSKHTRSFVKWPGGKYAELDVILNACGAPARYFEPFLGGGSVLWNQGSSVPSFGCDRVTELVDIYSYLKTEDGRFIRAVEAIGDLQGHLYRSCLGYSVSSDRWKRCIREGVPYLEGLSERVVLGCIERSVSRKRGWMLKHSIPESSRAEVELTGVMGGLFTAIRDSLRLPDLSPQWRAAAFWYVRDYAFSGMFRPSRRTGQEMVSYCGRVANSRSFLKKLALARSEPMRRRLEKTEFTLGDFGDFLDRKRPEHGDVVFLDPPYDRGFSSYNGLSFTEADHQRLADWMCAERAREGARIVMVIASTPFVQETYQSIPGFDVHAFAKNYNQSIKGRFSTEATHLLITSSEEV